MHACISSRVCGAAAPSAQRPHTRRKPIVRRATPPSDNGGAAEYSDSDGFGSQLRKWREPQTPQPSTSAASQQQTPAESLGQRLGNRLVLGNDMSEATWREMDKKLNKYPGFRTFSAIGNDDEGDVSFRAAMIAAVERVLGAGAVHIECVSQRPSSQGKYLSVRVGPVAVQNPDQVIQIFAEMKKDSRLKWYM